MLLWDVLGKAHMPFKRGVAFSRWTAMAARSRSG
jgi:hypothetical protein